jgi:hypothetical protein
MPLPVDSDLPLAGPGDEGSSQPSNPAPGTPGTLNITRKRAIGNSSYRIDPSIVCALPAITPGAQSAILVVEPAPGATAGKPLIRIWLDGQWPSVISGLPAYEGATLEINGADDLKNFRAISTDGRPHKLNIQFFSYL